MLQMHLVIASLSPVECAFAGHAKHAVPPDTFKYVPASHTKQSDDPFTALYLPGSQAMHSPPSGPVYPGIHTHDAASALPSGELAPFPVEHTEHTVPAL